MRRFGPPAVAAAALLGFILACGRAAALRPLPQEERLAAGSDEEALTLSLSHATPSWVLSKEQHATEQPPTTAGYEHSAMPELVIRKGYPLEEHFVTTADGCAGTAGPAHLQAIPPPFAPPQRCYGLQGTWVFTQSFKRCCRYVLGVYRISHGRAGPSDGRWAAARRALNRENGLANHCLPQAMQLPGPALPDAPWTRPAGGRRCCCSTACWTPAPPGC